jgi:phosphoribosylglycinamide formyltransferase 1
VKRVAILISGGGSNMAALLRDMVGDHPARAVLVASNDPSAKGLDLAASAGVPTRGLDHRAYPSRAAFEADLASALHAAQPDIIALAGFMRILSPAFVAQFEGRILNIHPSLLPKYPGLHTHARAITAGDKMAGCTVHRVTAELDAGPILGQAQVAIDPTDTPETLAARVLAQEHRLYPAVLRAYAGGDMRPIYLGADSAS